MDQNSQNNPESILHPSAEFGTIQNDAESFRTVPKTSESFGKVRNDSARFGNVPKASERKENHSLTVREAARLFEAAGVARTERSITNWCWPNRQGLSRLDSYFDPNERKYFITPESVEMAIAEERAKAVKINEPSEPVGNVRNDSERTPERTDMHSEDDMERVKQLEREVMDLKILNKGKDYFVEQLQRERVGFIDQLLSATRKVGELETKLLQVEAPKD